MTTAQDRLNQILPSWTDLLSQWSLDGSLVAAATDALMLESSNAKQDAKGQLQSYVSQWSAGNFQNLPEIVLLSSEDISGALGAYADSTDTIYLNEAWLQGASEEEIQKVLTEELGHFLDDQLNQGDTRGDEGALFSAELLGVELSDEEVAASQVEDDSVQITVDGLEVEAEASSISLTNELDLILFPEEKTGVSYYGIQLDANKNGDIYIGGNASLSSEESPGEFGIQLGGWIAKAGSDGRVIWAQKLPDGYSFDGSQFGRTLTSDSEGRVYGLITNNERTEIIRFDNDGILLGSTGISRNGQWERPQQIAVDDSGFVYASTDIDGPEYNGIVSIFDSDLNLVTIVSGINQDAELATNDNSGVLALGNGPWGSEFTITSIDQQGNIDVKYRLTQADGIIGFFALAKDELSGRIAIGGMLNDGKASGFIKVLDQDFQEIWSYQSYGRIDYKDLEFLPSGELVALGSYGGMQIFSEEGDNINESSLGALPSGAYLKEDQPVIESTYLIPREVELLPDGSLMFLRVDRETYGAPSLIQGDKPIDAFSYVYVNEAPTALTFDNTVNSLAENSDTSSSIKVADLQVTDDALGTNTLSLSGVDEAFFEIINGSLFLKAGTRLDFESKSSYEVNVSVQDLTVAGSTAVSQTFNLTVTDVNEAPINITLSSSGIAENSAPGIVVGTLSAEDPDAESNLTYALVAGDGTDDADNGLVEIIGNEVRVKTGVVIDFESNPVLDLYVQVTDSGGLTYTKALNASVLDVDEFSVGSATSDASQILVSGDLVNPRVETVESVTTGKGRKKVTTTTLTDIPIDPEGPVDALVVNGGEGNNNISGQGFADDPNTDIINESRSAFAGVLVIDGKGGADTIIGGASGTNWLIGGGTADGTVDTLTGVALATDIFDLRKDIGGSYEDAYGTGSATINGYDISDYIVLSNEASAYSVNNVTETIERTNKRGKVIGVDTFTKFEIRDAATENLIATVNGSTFTASSSASDLKIIYGQNTQDPFSVDLLGSGAII